MREHVIGHRDERILLAEHRTVLADQSQPVHVRIDHHAQIGSLGGDPCRDIGQVLGDRPGRMGEPPVGRAVHLDHLAPQFPEQYGHHDSSHRVDRIDDDAEPGPANRLTVDQRQGQHAVDMFAVVTAAKDDMPQRVHPGVIVGVVRRNSQHPFALGVAEELAARSEQLQRIPLPGIVAGRQNNPSVGSFARHGYLDRRRRGQPDIDHVDPAAAQRTRHDRGGHLARQASVASDDDPQAPARPVVLPQPPAVSRRELDQVERRQIFAGRSANRTPDTRNGFYQCHAFSLLK